MTEWTDDPGAPEWTAPDDLGAVEDSGPDPGTAPAPASAPGPSSEPTGDPADSPYYDREWRGAALYSCPEGDFPARSHQAVVKHIALAHPEPVEPDAATRAARAGIILAHR